MRPLRSAVVLAAGVVILASAGLARQATTTGPYKVLKTAKVGGEGGFDYIFADVEGRRLYIPRNGPTGQLTVFNLDTLDPAGAIAGVSAGGTAVDPEIPPRVLHHEANHDVGREHFESDQDHRRGRRPDGIMLDPYNERVWVLSHMPPYATVIDAKEGTVVGTIDLGGAPEQAVTDGKGTIYVNISNKANIAVVDAKTMTVTAHYDISAKGISGGSGLAFDAKDHVLFAYYRQPSPTVVIVSAENGDIITTLPTGTGVDTVAFNPATMEAISAEGGGSMTFIKESSPTSFAVEQTLQTVTGAKTLALDTKTNHLLTMTAEYGPPPANAPPGPAGRPARGPMVPDSFSILMVGR